MGCRSRGNPALLIEAFQPERRATPWTYGHSFSWGGVAALLGQTGNNLVVCLRARGARRPIGLAHDSFQRQPRIRNLDIDGRGLGTHWGLDRHGRGHPGPGPPGAGGQGRAPVDAIEVGSASKQIAQGAIDGDQLPRVPGPEHGTLGLGRHLAQHVEPDAVAEAHREKLHVASAGQGDDVFQAPDTVCVLAIRENHDGPVRVAAFRGDMVDQRGRGGVERGAP